MSYFECSDEHAAAKLLEAWLEASRLITYVHRCRNLHDEVGSTLVLWVHPDSHNQTQVFDHIMTYNPCVMATQIVADCIQGHIKDREVLLGVAESVKHLEGRYPSEDMFTGRFEDITWDLMADRILYHA